MTLHIFVKIALKRTDCHLREKLNGRISIAARKNTKIHAKGIRFIQRLEN